MLRVSLTTLLLSYCCVARLRCSVLRLLIGGVPVVVSTGWEVSNTSVTSSAFQQTQPQLHSVLQRQRSLIQSQQDASAIAVVEDHNAVKVIDHLADVSKESQEKRGQQLKSKILINFAFSISEK